MSKPTPGPWVNTSFTKFDDNPLESANDIRETVAASCDYSDRLELFGVTLNDADEHGRSTVVCYTGNGPNAHNNARLIAAAPDLLAACKGLISNHEALCAKAIDAGVLPPPDPEGPYMLAKTAVEKAEPGWVPPDDEPDEDDTAIYTETGGEG